jgi:predicted component of type VI protein secretion system
MSGLRAPLAATALAATILCGCGHTHRIGSRRVVQVTLSEYRITPQDIRGQAGPLTIFVHNFGRLSHNLSISLDGQAEASTQAIPPGQSAELSITLTPGTYQLASTILSDQALGAYGTLSLSR